MANNWCLQKQSAMSSRVPKWLSYTAQASVQDTSYLDPQCLLIIIIDT